MTICKPCHEKLHKKKHAQADSLKLKPRPVNTKHATAVSVVAARLRKYFADFEETFDFITKIDRLEQDLAKRHFIDAAVIASSGMTVTLTSQLIMGKKISKGDY